MSLILLTKSVKNIPSFDQGKELENILQRVLQSFYIIPKNLMKLFCEFVIQFLRKGLDLTGNSGKAFLGSINLELTQICQQKKNTGFESLLF